MSGTGHEKSIRTWSPTKKFSGVALSAKRPAGNKPIMQSPAPNLHATPADHRTEKVQIIYHYLRYPIQSTPSNHS